jgi:sugar lactone lactonase YvrE
MRFNDGKVSPNRDVLYAGTLQIKECASFVRETNCGSVYRIRGHSKGELGVQRCKTIGGVTISNGMDWSPDGSLMYYIDTQTSSIREYPFAISTGNVIHGNSRVVFAIDEVKFPGSRLDGMCVDVHGLIWVALIGGGMILRIDPSTAGVVQRLPVPTKLVTSCCFGGKNRSTLLITTAKGTTPDSIPKDESSVDAGAIFMVDLTGVTQGQPSRHFQFVGPWAAAL